MSKKYIFSYTSCLVYLALLLGGIMSASSEMHAASLIPTIHSTFVGGAWNDPNTWLEGRTPDPLDIVEINANVIQTQGSYSIHGLIVHPNTIFANSITSVYGDVVNDGTIQGGNIAFYENFTNNGTLQNIRDGFIYKDIYNSGIITNITNVLYVFGDIHSTGTLGPINGLYFGSSDAQHTFDTSNFLGYLDLLGDVSFTQNTTTLSGVVNTHGRKITLPDNGTLNILGGYYEGGEFIGLGTTLNLSGNMAGMSITGSLSQVNLLGDLSLYNTISISARNIYFGTGTKNISIISLYGDTINDGTIQGGNIAFYNNFTNHGTLQNIRDSYTYQNLYNDGTIGNITNVLYTFGDVHNTGTLGPINSLYFGSSDAQHILDTSSFLGNLILNGDASFSKNTTTLSGSVNTHGRKVTLPDNGTLNILSGYYEPGEYVGSGITLNIWGGMVGGSLTGSIGRVNILGDGWIGGKAYAKLLYFGSGTKNIQTVFEAFGDTINDGTIQGGNIAFYKSLTNHGILQNVRDGYVYEDFYNDGIINNITNVFQLGGNIQNTGIWTAAHTYAFWSPLLVVPPYTLFFSPGVATGVVVSGTSYDITDKISGQYTWVINGSNGAYYSRCINTAGCVTGLGTPIGAPLTLLSSIPSASATGVQRDSAITLNFSRPLDQLTVPGNIILRKTGGNVVDTAALSYSGNSIAFRPVSLLDRNNSYTVELKTGLKDMDGNNLGTATFFSFATVIALPNPINLIQQIQGPFLEKQLLRLGEKAGKYQSGSGVILSATTTITGSSRLVVDVYRIGSNMPNEFSSGYDTNETKEIIVPYLGAGDYYWKVKIENEKGDTSDWVDLGSNNPQEIDYTLYEGFEPYPYGYKFANNSPDNRILSGGISAISGTGARYKIDGNKWKIFNKVFPEYQFSDANKMFDSFESLGLNSNTGAFQGGNCFGLAASAIMQYAYPHSLEQYFPSFSAKVGTGTIWDKIEKLHTTFLVPHTWDVYDSTLETILESFLMQYDEIIVKETGNHTDAIDIYKTLQNNPNTTYILDFWGTGGKDKYEGHAVVPYKVESFPEGTRIYIWDNNIPYPSNKYGVAYDQYIEISSTGGWKVPLYEDWKSFDKISLVNIHTIDNLFSQLINGSKQSSPIGFNDHDMLAILNGASDLMFMDSLGRVSGFSGGTTIEQIPGVQVIVPLNATLSGAPDNTWKQIYLPQKKEGLTIKVSGKTGEKYDLMIAGGDYYTKIEGVTTSTGQLDSYSVNGTGVIIDFDNKKTGNYTLLTDNFQSTLTGTVFLSGITAIPGPQKFSYDWQKVLQNKSDAILYQIDTNSDSVYDISSNFPRVPTSPQVKGSISGYVRGNTNASMAGWKVSLYKNATNSCKEDKESKGKKEDKESKGKKEDKEDRECEDDRDDKKNKEIFAITDNKGYYIFSSLIPGSYSISVIPHENWTILKPQNNLYNLTLNNGQNIITLNFENTFLKGKNK